MDDQSTDILILCSCKQCVCIFLTAEGAPCANMTCATFLRKISE